MNTPINSKYKNKKFGIYGLGKTGISAIQFLQEIATEIYAWDDNIKNLNKIKEQFLNVIFSWKIELWQELDYIITSPGLPQNHPHKHKVYIIAKKNKIPLLSDVDLLLEHKKRSFFIAVTGSNGKSTTVSLIDHIFKYNSKSSCVAGNIGKASLNKDIVHNNIENYILELSSFQLEMLSKSTFFDIGVILNITPDHNERYLTFDDYFNAKALLIRHTSKLMIINIDYPYTFKLFNKLKKSPVKFQLLPISLNKVLSVGLSLINGVIYKNGIKLNISINLLKTDLHNENILASFAICQYSRVHYFLDCVYSFKGLPHRLEIIYKDTNLMIVNDSKATNTAATSIALKKFRKIHWIAGGVFKENNLEALAQFLQNIEHSYFIGQDSEKFVNFSKKKSLPYTNCQNLSAALDMIKSRVTNGTILLSPACASFDQWKDFTARGNEFKKLALQKFNVVS